MKTASWVIVNRATGKPICETYSQRAANSVNRKLYDVVPIGEWLARVNKQAREIFAAARARRRETNK